MESVASNSPSPDHHQPRPRFNPSQPIADRITRALQHPLRLLHRLNPKFFVLGATGNVYTVTLSTAPTCTCPDRLSPCKHILFTFIRVLGTALDDICIRRRTLRPCQLNRLLTTPTSPDALAAACIRDRFHQLYSQQSVRDSQPTIEVEEGAACPVCLDGMRRGERIVACGTCRNPLHQKCMLMWKRSKRKRSANCVICRARWSNRMDQENYMNLSAYICGGTDTVDNCGEQCGAISTVSSTSMHGNSNKVIAHTTTAFCTFLEPWCFVTLKVLAECLIFDFRSTMRRSYHIEAQQTFSCYFWRMPLAHNFFVTN